jgi:hypothetical protein
MRSYLAETLLDYIAIHPDLTQREIAKALGYSPIDGRISGTLIYLYTRNRLAREGKPYRYRIAKGRKEKTPIVENRKEEASGLKEKYPEVFRTEKAINAYHQELWILAKIIRRQDVKTDPVQINIIKRRRQLLHAILWRMTHNSIFASNAPEPWKSAWPCIRDRGIPHMAEARMGTEC